MQREALQPEGLATPKPPYSPVIVSGDLVYMSGQVPYDADGKLVSEEFAAQARQTFENLGRCLAAAGCGFGDVLKVNVFLTDLGNFPTLNQVYEKYFTSPYPARSTVGVQLIGFDIEVEAVARRPG